MSDVVAIEAGGTKFVLAWGASPGNLHDRIVIPTVDPQTTMPQVIDYIKQAQGKTKITAIGAAFFGPLDVDRQSDRYGYITVTPKLAWRNFNVVGCLQQAFDLPIGFDTDVNAAALGEWRWGSAQGLTDFIYLTVGTGIGGGGMSGGQLIHGAMHPEMGHMLVPHDTLRDPFAGLCHYHQDCLEGLASGPAIKERWQVGSALDLSPEHPAWALEAEYLAKGLMNFTLALAPQRIIMGGGVMRQTHLLAMVRKQLSLYINGYLSHQRISAMNDYLVAPQLKEDAGVVGALALAQSELMENSDES